MLCAVSETARWLKEFQYFRALRQRDSETAAFSNFRRILYVRAGEVMSRCLKALQALRFKAFSETAVMSQRCLKVSALSQRNPALAEQSREFAWRSR